MMFSHCTRFFFPISCRILPTFTSSFLLPFTFHTFHTSTHIHDTPSITHSARPRHHKYAPPEPLKPHARWNQLYAQLKNDRYTHLWKQVINYIHKSKMKKEIYIIYDWITLYCIYCISINLFCGLCMFFYVRLWLIFSYYALLHLLCCCTYLEYRRNIKN